jgi:hypothetical protein
VPDDDRAAPADRSSAPSDAPTPPKKRETPWSVFIVAGIFFAIGLWLYLDVRREVKEIEERKARAPAVESAKPKILGLDVIPQLAESNEAKMRGAPSASASVSAAPLAPSAAPK